MGTTPYIARTDRPGKRPATWLECAQCGLLFLRATKEVNRTRRPKNFFCSKQCASLFQYPPVMRDCVICGNPFRAYRQRKGLIAKSTTCPYCTAGVLPPWGQRRMPIVIYAYEHGIMADYAALKCESCGTGQREWAGHHYHVSLTRISGRYVARCKRCYELSR